MSGRPQHNDGGIVERRLRPIYDWLDIGNNRKALQEAAKVLKKSPSLQAARALKALALLRLGKNGEAHSVLEALAEEKPCDDTTLQAMTISYRESQQLHKVCNLYETAVKADPSSEELHTHLFMSYVRVGDHRSQQRAAMALYKFSPKNPYYFWAVMSIVLQAKSSEDSIKKGILLTLAQRMVDNFINDNKMEAEQEARLYIMILELQDKSEDILKFLESPLYANLVPGSMPQASMPYFRKLGQWGKLNLLCKDLLLDNPDRWDYYMPYFDSVFELIKGSSENCDDKTDDTTEKCHEFICLIVEGMSHGKALRGPYLARLELWKRLAEVGDPTVLLGSGVALCVQYLRVFAHKPCAVPDLRQYLDMLSQKEREDHSREFLTCLGFDENSEPESPDDIQRHVSCLGAWRLTAPPGDAEFNMQLAATLRGHYLRCLRAGHVTSTPTEFCAAEMYALLSAHHYYYAAAALSSSQPVVEALCLLELVLHHSPANFHAKLLLIQLYHSLGAALAADDVYRRVEVKHVQLLSLGWLHAARLAPGCAARRALQLLRDTAAFHTHHAKESVEHLSYAYKYGSFEKLVQLSAWGERLDACAWAALVGRERALRTREAAVAPPPPPLPPLPEEPRDNRDLDVIVHWLPAQLRDPALRARTFAHDLRYLRVKDALVHARGGAGCGGEGAAAAGAAAAEGARGLHEPARSRLFAFINSPIPYREIYNTAFSIAADLSGERSGAADLSGERSGAADLSGERSGAAHDGCERLAQLLDESVGQLRRAVAGGLGDGAGDPVWRVGDVLEELSNYLEMIGILTHTLSQCYELLTPTHTKSKKKHQSPAEAKTSELLAKINEHLRKCIDTTEEQITKWPEYKTTSTLEEQFSALNLESGYSCPVLGKLVGARSEVIDDVQKSLKKKLLDLKALS